jgi:hypothetical protein
VETAASQTAELAQQLSATMAAIHRRGWCDGTGGNFSCVLRWQPLELLMAPSGVDKGSVAPEQLIVVDAAGAVLKGTGRASAETALLRGTADPTGSYTVTVNAWFGPFATVAGAVTPTDATRTPVVTTGRESCCAALAPSRRAVSVTFPPAADSAGVHSAT